VAKSPFFGAGCRRSCPASSAFSSWPRLPASHEAKRPPFEVPTSAVAVRPVKLARGAVLTCSAAAVTGPNRLLLVPSTIDTTGLAEGEAVDATPPSGASSSGAAPKRLRCGRGAATAGWSFAAAASDAVAKSPFFGAGSRRSSPASSTFSSWPRLPAADEAKRPPLVIRCDASVVSSFLVASATSANKPLGSLAFDGTASTAGLLTADAKRPRPGGAGVLAGEVPVALLGIIGAARGPNKLLEEVEADEGCLATLGTAGAVVGTEASSGGHDGVGMSADVGAGESTAEADCNFIVSSPALGAAWRPASREAKASSRSRNLNSNASKSRSRRSISAVRLAKYSSTTEWSRGTRPALNSENTALMAASRA